MSEINDLNTFSEESNQEKSTYENILEYFDNYIKSFTPYRNEPVYRAFIEFLIKEFINIIYNIQPSEFKSLFEDQIISSSIIDTLLVSIGIPENLINTLTVSTKIIIMKTFSDFERYKGTVKFIRTIGTHLNDTISYYELYIDYDKNYINPVGSYLVTFQLNKIKNNSYFLLDSVENNYYVWFNFDNSGKDPKLDNKIGIEIPVNSRYDTNKSITQKIIFELNLTNEFYVKINSNDLLEINLAKPGFTNGFNPGTTQLKYTVLSPPLDNGSWILRPKPIFVHPKMKQNTNIIRYKDAYNRIPNLLISEEHLNNKKKNNNIVLPIKSNILLLDYNSDIESDYLNTLYFTIIMDYIGEDYLTLYLSGEKTIFPTTYKNIIYFWYYLIQLYYNTTLTSIQLKQQIVMGSVHSSEHTINDIPKIEEEYKDIKTRPELINFYNKYISSQYLKLFSSLETSLDNIRENAKRFDAELYNYINNRIISSEDQKYEIQLILDEIYASIILSFSQYSNNEILYKYIDVIVKNLTLISTDIKNTDSYKLVKELKPFHTDLLDIASNKIVIQNKFNALLMSIYLESIFTYMSSSALHLSDQIICKIPIAGQNSLSLVTEIRPRCTTETIYDSISDNMGYKFIKKYYTSLLSDNADKSIINYKLIHDDHKVLIGWDYEYGNYYSGETQTTKINITDEVNIKII